jgi:hypothetical protein
MLKILAIICDVFVAITFCFGLLVLFYLFGQISNLPLPDVFVSGMDWLMSPFLAGIRDNFGERVWTVKDRSVDMNPGILIVLTIITFIILLVTSNILHGLHYKVITFIGNLRHHFFLWKTKQAESRVTITSLGNTYDPEIGAVVAFQLANFHLYPALKSDLEKRLAALNIKQKIMQHDDRLMLRFNSTAQAFIFIYDFCKQFKTMTRTMRLIVDQRPGFQIAVHSLADDQTIYNDEGFLWAMLAVTAPSQVFVSTNAKEQFDMHCKMQELAFPFEVIQVGTFAKLGNRTHPDVYRLSFLREEMGEVS